MTRTIRWLTIPALTAALTIATIQLAAARGGGHGGHSHSSSRCVGVCYGVTSTKTGLPRNTYVTNVGFPSYFLNSIQKSLDNPCQKQTGQTRRDNLNPVDFGRHYFNLSHMAAADALR